MSPSRVGPGPSPEPNFIAIIDIGSNSIRLVVFDGLRRTPNPVFNEKILCGLGRGLDLTGRLNPDGVRMAHENLDRLVALAHGMGVSRPEVVATAAVRDAADGPAFVAAVEARCGVQVQVLSGEEEARFSALGMIAGIPEADGIMGDLGGGSLELVAIDSVGLGLSATLPLGPLRLNPGLDDRDGHYKMDEVIGGAISGVPWLATGAGRDFYPVGGAWRAIARIHMAQNRYPLRIIDHYTLFHDELDTLLAVIMRQTPESLGPVLGVSRGRMETLPVAARVLRRLLREVRPRQIVFSAQGLREGLLYHRLSDSVQSEDPLLSACRDMAAGLSRFAVFGDEVLAWTAPLFPDEDAAGRRLREACCLLADIGWSEHPEYRAEHTFYKTFRLTGIGVDHTGRAFLALALVARYGGGVHRKVLAGARALLAEDEARRAQILGLALRLAVYLSGSVPAVLAQSALRMTDDALCLELSPGAEIYLGAVVRRRLDALATALGRRPEILVQESELARRK